VTRTTFPSAEALRPHRFFSRWDLVVIPLVLVGLYLLTVAFRGVVVPFAPGTPDMSVSLDPVNLPYYGLRTLFRMLLAVLAGLVFTLTYATLAAKSRRAEQVLIPILDFLQSLPILGFLTVTTSIFLGVFRGSLLGLEAASIFAIFTSQVWNMAFSFYHSLVTTPEELSEVASALRLSGWQKFWKLEVPFAMPALIWNTMMSVSGGWFFVVASEAITVAGRDSKQYLPGIGSYIARAIQESDVRAMVYAGIALFLLVLLYDQLVFRPIVAWSDKFKYEQSAAQEAPRSWMLTLVRRSQIIHRANALVGAAFEVLGRAANRVRLAPRRKPASLPRVGPTIDRAWTIALIGASLAPLFLLGRFMFGPELGLAGGRVLAPNTNLNVSFDPRTAATFASAGVVVGTDQTVYLSDVCGASSAGRNVSPALGLALHGAGSESVPAPTDLVASCDAQLVPPGDVAWSEVPQVAGLGLITMTRVVALIVLATLFWTPIGVWIGLRPRVAELIQPLAQFAAAFPANLLFPIAVVLITTFGLNVEVWVSPLMVLGTQWYILFNVVAGTVAIPNDLKEAARVAGLRGLTWWRTLVLPAIFPAFVTGGITASGGSWNASIVAEVVTWGSITLVATGLGAYIARWSTGEFNPHVALGMVVMGLLVLTFNRLIWRRLYHLAETRYRLG
jgi:NitT/TauT family transport system permease protein